MNTTPPPLDPILIPDSPAGSPSPAVTKSELSPVAGINKSTRKPPAPAKPRRPRKPEKVTLEDAFDYFNVPDGADTPELTDINLERALRSVTFLLEWLSHHGNESVDGFVAHGLAQVLDRCAQGVRRP
jgi:hypothetical protein